MFTGVEGLHIYPLHVHPESLSVGPTLFWGLTFISLDHHQLTQYLLVYSSQWDTISVKAPISHCLPFTAKTLVFEPTQRYSLEVAWLSESWLPHSPRSAPRWTPFRAKTWTCESALPGRASRDLAPAYLCPWASLSSTLATPLVLLPCPSDLLILVLLLVLCTSWALCPMSFSHLAVYDLLLLTIYFSTYMALFQKDLPWCPQSLSHHCFLNISISFTTNWHFVFILTMMSLFIDLLPLKLLCILPTEVPWQQDLTCFSLCYIPVPRVSHI